MEIPSTGKGRFLTDRLNRLYHRLLLKPLLEIYLRNDTSTRIGGFRLKVFRHVFHPAFFFSTRYFYEFLEKREMKGRRFLEIGCGSGILSMLAFRKQAQITAVDIDERAIANTRYNFSRNFDDFAGVKLMVSDVFDQIPPGTFDLIAINPPYYFKNPGGPGEQAWYCGEAGEYFSKLFAGLRERTHDTSEVYMILEENCELDRIRQIATELGVSLILSEQKKIRWETNYIFRLVNSGAA